MSQRDPYYQDLDQYCFLRHIKVQGNRLWLYWCLYILRYLTQLISCVWTQLIIVDKNLALYFDIHALRQWQTVHNNWVLHDQNIYRNKVSPKPTYVGQRFCRRCHLLDWDSGLVWYRHKFRLQEDSNFCCKSCLKSAESSYLRYFVRLNTCDVPERLYNCLSVR